MENLLSLTPKKMKIFFAIYIIVAIVVLVIIWLPSDDKISEISYYNNYSDEEVSQKLASYYVNRIKNTIILGEDENISERINEYYLRYNDVTKEQVIADLKKNDFFNIRSKIENVTVNKYGTDYIYSFDVVSGKYVKRVNIIESLPYNYAVSFDDVVYYREYNTEQDFDGLKVKVEGKLNKLNKIQYTVNIHNVSYTKAEVNLSTVTDAYVIYTDGTRISLENPINLDSELKINTSIKRDINFVIPISSQESIQYILFTNVKLDGRKTSLKIEI